MKKVSAVILMVLLFIILFQIRQVKAINIMGAEITWTCVGVDSFFITFTFYQDCNATILNAPKVYIKNISSGSVSDTITYGTPSVQDITPVCNKSCSRCSSSACSFPYGISQRVYQQLVILNSANYGCSIVFYFKDCCRQSSITTGASGQGYYTESIMNRCLTPVDNSPTFLNPPIAILCQGKDFLYNIGVVDIDLDSTSGLIDSISYEWTAPLQSAGTNTSWTSSYNYDKPIYFWGFPNPKLPFPRGIQINEATGDISFRPMKNEQTVMAIKVVEWRNIKGTMTKIGEIRRDIQIIVISCPSNHSPVLSGPFYKEVCAGSAVTFSIATNDYDTPDTLTISYQGNLPGASWSSNNGKTKHPTGTLTWTPDSSMASQNLYSFTVTVKDDVCPMTGTDTRGYQILVKPAPQNATIKTEITKCNHVKFTGNAYSKLTPNYEWEIGSINPLKINNSKSFTFYADTPGVYPVKLAVGISGCNYTYAFDTLKLDTFLYVHKMPDVYLCKGDTAVLKPNFYLNRGKVNFYWSNGSKNSELKISPLVTTLYKVALSDSFGCEALDTVKVVVYERDSISLGPDRFVCSNESPVLKATIINYSPSNSVVWWTIHRTGQDVLNDNISYTAPDSGQFSCYVKNKFGCVSSDLIYIHKNPEIKAFSPDITTCFKDSIGLIADSTGSRTNNVSYAWYDYSTNKLLSIIQYYKFFPLKTNKLKLKVFEYLNNIGCSDEHIVNVKVNFIRSGFNSNLTSCYQDTNIDLWKSIDTNQISLNINHPSVLINRYYNPSLAQKERDTMIVKITDLHNTCSHDTSIYFNVFPLPAVNAYTPYGLLDFCPEYGLVSLFGTPSGGKYGGKWLGSVDSGKYFNTNKNLGIYPVIYQFRNDKGCINSDTLFFSIVLPEIHIDKSDLAICTHENASLASSIKSANKMLWSINSSSDGYFHNSLNNPQNIYQPGNKDKFNKGFWIYAQTVDTVCKAAYDSAYFNINAVPKPDFISHTDEGQNPLNVQFSDSSKIEYGNISNWNWNFGDGNTSTLQNPVHQYNTSGKFDVKLKVISDSLCSDSIRKNAMIYVWPLSLNEEGTVKVQVYPNPANNQLIVKVQSQGITITHFVLCNFIGAKVMELNNINMSQAIIDRKHLAAGLYFLKVDDSAGNRHVFQVVFE